jgi:hypothetical protein
MNDAYTEATDLAAEVVQMVESSTMHKSLVYAALMLAVADVMADCQVGDHVTAVRRFAEDIRKRAIVT